MPLKINPYAEFSGNDEYNRYMVCLDGLLCFLSQTNPYFTILEDVFGTYFTGIENPYFYVDKNLEGNYRFKSNYFGDTNYKINYLVSRLDGLNYNDVKNLIDRSALPDRSGNNLFLLDAHESSGLGVSALRSDATRTNSKLNYIGYNNFLDLTDNIYYSSSSPVIAYTSSGAHAGMPSNYNYLFSFEKPNGAIYNTYESYNGFYMDTLNLWNRQGAPNYHGMITEWLRVGGSGGAGHTYEPTVFSVTKDSIFFPLYAIGYSLIDAAYQGIPYLGFRNVVIGDPLITVAWGKQTLTANTTLSGINLVTGKITVPAGKTLTIASNAVINFKHFGSLEINGTLTIQPGATLNFYNGNSLVVNNVINANGTSNSKIIFDFISQNSSTYNGIVLNENSSGRISHAIIRNAYYGIKVDQGIPSEQTDPFIEYCEIYNCYDGLYLYQSDYQLTMYTGTKIWHNKIHDNDHAGIYLLDSEPQIAGDSIYNNPIGISCITGSHAVFGELGDPGANVITVNATSIYSNYSSPLIGHDDPEMFFGGYNTIAGEDYHLYAENGGYIFAELNYWGADSTKIVAASGSIIDYRPFLSFESCLAYGNGGTNETLSKSSSNISSSNDKLTKALKLFLQKDNKQAWDICKELLEESSVSTDEVSDLTFMSTINLIDKF